MSGQIYIAYNRADAGYVRKLASFLRAQGFRLWTDEQLEPGDNWAEIQRHELAASSALIVVLSPALADAPGVLAEIDLAQEFGVPIFPLLRSGRPLALREIQYEDVRNGAMPSRRFTEILRLNQKVQPAPHHADVPVGGTEHGSSRQQPPTPGPTGAPPPDWYALFSRALDEMKRQQLVQMIYGALIGLPVGVLGSYLAYILGWA